MDDDPSENDPAPERANLPGSGLAVPPREICDRPPRPPAAIEGESGKRSLAGRRRRGLRKLPPALVGQALDETAASITRIVLTFVGAALFCLLSLLTPDTALLTVGERLNVPFAGPVSFLGFIFVGPAVLIALRVYLQIYAEHWLRLEAIRRRLPSAPRAPALTPLRNPLVRGFTGFVLHLLLPLAMVAFTWKAAVFPAWGAGLLCATVAVIVGHVLLPLRQSWRVKAQLSVGAALLAFAAAISQGPIRRPFDLFRAQLSNQWLPDSDLRGAILHRADLTGANLRSANLAGANLRSANLAGANLRSANLAGADLTSANLAGADLTSAELTGAVLVDANLTGAELWVASFRGAVLVGANLAGASLWRAKLTGADLQDANFDGALLVETRFADKETDPARNLTQAQIDRAWTWADAPPLDLDRLDPPLALPKSRFCDPALGRAWAEELNKGWRGERSYGPPAACSGAAGAGVAARSGGGAGP